MSSSAADGSGDGGQKPRGFSKFMRRASTVLKRDKTKRQSASGTTALAPVKDDSATSSTPAPPQPSTQAPTSSTTAAVAPPVPSKDTPDTTKGTQDTQANKEPVRPIKPKSATTAAENNKIQEEKARALFAKYNMTLEIGEWVPPFKGDAERVEKKVRMRVHRHCHRCQVMFGVEKQCGNCGHTRCTKCPKTPMSSQKNRKSKSVVTGGIIVDDRHLSGLGPDFLAMPYRRTGRELPGTTAIRRVCHKCQTVFFGNAPQCGTCGHLRCAQCPQDPPLSFPITAALQPRRRQMRELRVRIRYTCHECRKTFKDLETKCSRCGHAKCERCPRGPNAVNAPEIDPEVLKKFEERLRNLEVSPQAAAA